jgi:hypothetical protein
MADEQVLTPEEKLEHIRAFLRSPIWTSILKPAITVDFNLRVKKLVGSSNPQEDYETKAEIRAWGRLLDFEKSALGKIRDVEAALAEEKQRVLAEVPEGTPYGR